MTTWVTSDLHFGHANILKFNPGTRQYADVADMNAKMMAEWNSKVAFDDTVYILGDFAFLKANEAARIAGSLMGKKHLIVGNHDKKLVADPRFCSQFESIQDYLEMEYVMENPNFNQKSVKLVMFHFPIAEWNRCHHGAVHLYGHLHGSRSGLEYYRTFDVGVDSEVLNPGHVVRTMDDVVGYALTGKIKTHGDGN